MGDKACPYPGALAGEYSLGTKWWLGNKDKKVGSVLHPAVWNSHLPKQRRVVFLIHFFQQKHLTWCHLGEGRLG